MSKTSQEDQTSPGGQVEDEEPDQIPWVIKCQGYRVFAKTGFYSEVLRGAQEKVQGPD